MAFKTAERVSQDVTDNFVYRRSRLAYIAAREVVGGEVLEIGTGTGYGVEIIAPHTTRFTTLDKHRSPVVDNLPEGVEFLEAKVPPLPFEDERFDCVVSFQVIEHIKSDRRFVREVYRVLKKGGRFIVTTPNRRMSLTRNPWHVREYTSDELKALLSDFASVETYGVYGNDKVMAYYSRNRESVRRIMRFDILKMQWWLPRRLLQLPYDILNRINRKGLHSKNRELTESIREDDYEIREVGDNCFDLFYIAKK